MPVSAVCERLALSERELRGVVTQAATDGYLVRIRDGHVFCRVPVGAGATVTVGAAIRGRAYKFLHWSDTHFGSTHCDENGSLDFLHRGWEAGARICTHTGDMIDGTGPHADKLRADQAYTSWDGQTDRVLRVLKKAPPFTYVAIDGNHDGYSSSAMGCMSGQQFAYKAKEAGIKWNFLGMCLGRAVIHGARTMLWHPMGAGTTRNAVRLALNTRVEALEEPCDFLLAGHFHRRATLLTVPEGVFASGGGTFQRKGSEFANRSARNWDFGGWILRFELDRKGAVAFPSAEWVPAKPPRMKAA